MPPLSLPRIYLKTSLEKTREPQEGKRVAWLFIWQVVSSYLHCLWMCHSFVPLFEQVKKSSPHIVMFIFYFKLMFSGCYWSLNTTTSLPSDPYSNCMQYINKTCIISFRTIASICIIVYKYRLNAVFEDNWKTISNEP